MVQGSTIGLGLLAAGGVAVATGAVGQGSGESGSKKGGSGGSSFNPPGRAVGLGGLAGVPNSRGQGNSPGQPRGQTEVTVEAPEFDGTSPAGQNTPGSTGDSPGGGGGSSTKKESNSSSSSGGGSIDTSNIEPDNTFSKKEKQSIEKSTPDPSDSPAEATKKLNNQGYTRSQSTSEMDSSELPDLTPGGSGGSKKEQKSSDSGGGFDPIGDAIDAGSSFLNDTIGWGDV